MATTRRNALKSIRDSNPKYSIRTAAKMRDPQVSKPGPPLPRLYIDTITAAFGEKTDLHRDVLKISPDAASIEQRIAYFKRGREVMKEAGSPITAPRDLPPAIRSRLKAINMAYEIVSNPEWQRQYATRSDSPPRVKCGVRFNDQIQEHVFEREPWEEAYMQEKREQRMQRLQKLEDEIQSHDSFWADLMLDMEYFEQGLDGFFQAFPDPMSGTELRESLSDDSSFPDTQSFSSWLSGSHKKEDPDPNDDIETTSYMSSFNPFAEETPQKASSNNVRSPTSLPQELAETSRVPRAAKKQGKGNRNRVRDIVAPSSNSFADEDDVTNPLDISHVTSPFDDEDLDVTNPLRDTPDNISNPFSTSASDSRFSIGTFQKMQKTQKARRSTRSSGSQLSKQAAPETTRRTQRQSKNPFEVDINDMSGDQTSVFDGLEDIWEDEGVHVDGVSVISDLSESVVAKRAKQNQQPFDPFGIASAIEDTRGSSEKRVRSVGNPSWGGSENEQVGFTAAASAIAACCANMVADCQKSTQAMANLEMKNFTQIDKDFFPGLFGAEQSKKTEQDTTFDEMQELFNEVGGELNNELGEYQ